MANIYIPKREDGEFATPTDIKAENDKLIITWLLPNGDSVTTTTDFEVGGFDKYKGYLTDEELYAIDTTDYIGGEFCFNHSVEYGVYMYVYVVEGSRREWTQDATSNWISRSQLEDEGIVLKSYATREPSAGDFIFKAEKDAIKIYDWDKFDNKWQESGEISHSFHADFFYANKLEGGFRQLNEFDQNINVHKLSTTPNAQMYGDPRSDNIFIGSKNDIVKVTDSAEMVLPITDNTDETKTLPLEHFGTFELTIRDEYLGLSRAIRPTSITVYVDKLLDKDNQEIFESYLWFSITDISNPSIPKLIFETGSITGLPLEIGYKIHKGENVIPIDILNYLLVGNKYQMRVCSLATQVLKGETVEGSFLPKSHFKFHIVEEYKMYGEYNLGGNEVRNKLSELEDENRLDAKYIKNLPQSDLSDILNELRFTEQQLAIVQQSTATNTNRTRLNSIKIAINNQSIKTINKNKG